jgi:hypothetical protein
LIQSIVRAKCEFDGSSHLLLSGSLNEDHHVTSHSRASHHHVGNGKSIPISGWLWHPAEKSSALHFNVVDQGNLTKEMQPITVGGLAKDKLEKGDTTVSESNLSHIVSAMLDKRSKAKTFRLVLGLRRRVFVLCRPGRKTVEWPGSLYGGLLVFSFLLHLPT